MAVSKSIAERVKAIIDKARSSTHDGEISALMAKAQELMAKHGLDLLDVEHAGDPLELDRALADVRNGWQCSLFAQVACYFGCSCMFVRGFRGARRETVAVAGKLSARETVKVMWPYVLEAVHREASRARTRGELKGDAETGKKNVGLALAHRICLMIAERDRELNGESGGNALIVIDQAQAVINDAYPNATEMRHKNDYDPDAAEAAGRIGLDLQAGYKGEVKKLT